MRIRDEPRVGGEHAVDVGPDLDLGGAEAGADDRRRVVGPAAAERRGHAVARGADEAAHHGNPPRGKRRIDVRHQRRRGLGKERRGRRVLAVGDHRAPRVNPRRRAAPATVSADATMRLLSTSPVAAIASNQRGDTSRSTARASTMRSSSSNARSMNAINLLALHRIADDMRHGDVPLAKLAQIGARAVEVAGAGIGGDAEQAVRDFRQSRDHHDGPARIAAFLLCVCLPLRADDGDQPLDGDLVGDRRPAKLHHDHQARSKPFGCHQLGIENRRRPPRRARCCDRAPRSSRASTLQDRTRPTVMAMPSPRSASRRGCGRLLFGHHHDRRVAVRSAVRAPAAGR